MHPLHCYIVADSFCKVRIQSVQVLKYNLKTISTVLFYVCSSKSCFKVKIFSLSPHPSWITCQTVMWGTLLILPIGIHTCLCTGLYLISTNWMSILRVVHPHIITSIICVLRKTFTIAKPSSIIGRSPSQTHVTLSMKMKYSIMLVMNKKSATVRNLMSWIIPWWRLTVGNILRSDHFLPQIAEYLLSHPLQATFKSTGTLAQKAAHLGTIR